MPRCRVPLLEIEPERAWRITGLSVSPGCCAIMAIAVDRVVSTSPILGAANRVARGSPGDKSRLTLESCASTARTPRTQLHPRTERHELVRAGPREGLLVAVSRPFTTYFLGTINRLGRTRIISWVGPRPESGDAERQGRITATASFRTLPGSRDMLERNDVLSDTSSRLWNLTPGRNTNRKSAHLRRPKMTRRGSA